MRRQREYGIYADLRHCWVAALWCISFALIGCATARTARLEPQVSLARAGDSLLARVSVNNADAGWFIIDLSSAETVIDQSVVRRLSLPVLAARWGNSPSGKMNRLAELSKMEVGSVECPPHLTLEKDLGWLRRRVGTEVSGILGASFFRGQPFTIDYPNAALIFLDASRFAANADRGNRVPLRMIGGVPAVQADLEGVDNVWPSGWTAGSSWRHERTAYWRSYTLKVS